MFWLASPPEAMTADEEDLDDAESSESRFRQRTFDPKTGLPPTQGGTGITPYEIDTVEDPEERARYVTRCPACGGRSSAAEAEIVTRMHPGNEALSSVVVQQVLEALPERPDPYGDPLPMNGRALLTFSDNRQNAAFFAPYFERTAGEQALRSAIHQALSGEDDPIDLELLFEEVYKVWKRMGRPVLIDENGEVQGDKRKMRDRLMGRIAAELCTPGGRRNSLEALGLVRVSWEHERYRRLLRDVTALIPERHRDQAEPLLRFLLETIRREKAILSREIETTLLTLPNAAYVEGTSRLLHRISHVAGRLTQELNAATLTWPKGDHFRRHSADDQALARELFGETTSSSPAPRSPRCIRSSCWCAPSPRSPTRRSCWPS